MGHEYFSEGEGSEGFDKSKNDMERKANLMRILTREKLEAKRTAEKQGKDYTFSDSLPINLKMYRAEKKSKSKEVAALEKIFSDISDSAFKDACIFAKVWLGDWETDDLKFRLKYFKGSEDDELTGELKKMYKLNQKYVELTGRRDPNYDKYIAYIWTVTSKIEKELNIRKKILGDSYGRTW